jgi:hypothetical protein
MYIGDMEQWNKLKVAKEKICIADHESFLGKGEHFP